MNVSEDELNSLYTWVGKPKLAVLFCTQGASQNMAGAGRRHTAFQA